MDEQIWELLAKEGRWMKEDIANIFIWLGLVRIADSD